MRKLPIALLLAAGALALAIQPGCASTTPARNPVGEVFPDVEGTGLDDQTHDLPAELAGAPAVLLVGYVQDAQFDADRWLLGLLDSGLEVRVLELPTIRGWVPGLLASRIDEGMRAGIPEEDWSSVVTVYDDAAPIVALTGNEKTRNIRVLLVDSEGVVRWFHDRGYSAGKLIELRSALSELSD